MVKFLKSKLEVRNVSYPKNNVQIPHLGVIRPGQTVNLCDSKHITESMIIEWFREPTGFLYIETKVRRRLKVVSCDLVTYSNVLVEPSHLKAEDGKSNQILSLNKEGQLEWIDRHDISNLANVVNKSVKVHSPLAKRNNSILIPKANEHTSGYLSKEDWLFFHGKANGIRIWQYQDFDNILGTKLELNKFENGQMNSLFVQGYIVHESAVIIDNDTDKAPRKKDSSWFNSNKYVKVDKHLGTDVILNAPPNKGTKCRIWYLIILPEYIEIPREYEPPSEFIRSSRVEVIDAIDIGNYTRSRIQGDKSFAHSVHIDGDVSIDSGLSVDDNIKADSIQLLDNPNTNYVLVSDAVGNGSWQPNPLVASAPPKHFYNGQTWIRTPEYELHVRDGIRNKWLSVSTFSVIGAKNSTHLDNSYLDTFDNIPMDFNTAVLPYDATLVCLTASCENESSWSAEIHVNHQLVSGALLNVNVRDFAHHDKLNIDFKEGDKIQLFVSGHGIMMPRVEAIFKRRA